MQDRVRIAKNVFNVEEEFAKDLIERINRANVRKSFKKLPKRLNNIPAFNMLGRSTGDL